jgi:hypothetical protein
VAEAVDAVGHDLLLEGLQLTSDDCLPVLGVDVVLNGAVTDCADRNEATFVLLTHNVRLVILPGAWIQYLGDYNKVLRLLGGADASLPSTAALSRQLNQTIHRLQGAGIEVVIVGPVPHIDPAIAATISLRSLDTD